MKLNELMDLNDMKKQIDPKEMRTRIIKSGGNFLDTKLSKAAKKLKNAFKK